MGESVGLIAKTPEVKQSNSNSRIQKTARPRSMGTSADSILFLQRTVGNRAVSRLIRSGGLQAKFRIGQPGDVYEQEADRVADEVMRMPEPGLQRQVGPKEEEETLQIKPLVDQITPVVQRQVEEEEEEEEMLQAKSSEDATPEVSHGLESQINAIKGGGRPLAESERAYFEPRFGADFSQVKVHTDAKAAESARAVNARAFTSGSNVFFWHGQYSPQNVDGRKLLAHELAHVIQQSPMRRSFSGESQATLALGNTVAHVQRTPAVPAAIGAIAHELVGEPYGRGTTCQYEEGEVAASKTSPGKQETIPSSGHPPLLKQLFWDYGVGKHDLKPGHNMMTKYYVGALGLNQTDPSWKVVEIVGYTDCADTETTNLPIRRNRAKTMLDNLDHLGALRANLPFSPTVGYKVGPWGNQTSRNGRARNRSVLVIFKWQKSPVVKPKPKPKPKSHQYSCGIGTDMPSKRWALSFNGYIAGPTVNKSDVLMWFDLKNLTSNCVYDAEFLGKQKGVGLAIGSSGSYRPTYVNFRTTIALQPISLGFCCPWAKLLDLPLPPSVKVKALGVGILRIHPDNRIVGNYVEFVGASIGLSAASAYFEGSFFAK